MQLLCDGGRRLYATRRILCEILQGHAAEIAVKLGLKAGARAGLGAVVVKLLEKVGLRVGGVDEGAIEVETEARAAWKGEGDFISVYHASINNATVIREFGLDPEKLPAWVTRDIRAAQDAISNNRYDVQQGLARDPGIIESRIPKEDFDRLLAIGEREYPGFNGRFRNPATGEAESSEIVLRTLEQLDLFNRHIVR